MQSWVLPCRVASQGTPSKQVGLTIALPCPCSALLRAQPCPVHCPLPCTALFCALPCPMPYPALCTALPHALPCPVHCPDPVHCPALPHVLPCPVHCPALLTALSCPAPCTALLLIHRSDPSHHVWLLIGSDGALQFSQHVCTHAKPRAWLMMRAGSTGVVDSCLSHPLCQVPDKGATFTVQNHPVTTGQHRGAMALSLCTENATSPTSHRG